MKKLLKKNTPYCGTAVITPFKKDGSIDFKAYEKVIKAQLKGGIDMLAVGATTGEGATMNIDEICEIVSFTKKISGNTPVIGGCSSNVTLTVTEYGKKIEKSGADALLTASPHYNKPTASGLIAHYTALADSVKIPVILYNVPGRTAACIPADTVAELSKHKNIIAVKEASGNLEYMMSLKQKCTDDFIILSGDDALTLPMISCGVTGVISVCSNQIPAEMTQMVKYAVEGNNKKAQELHYKYLELMKINFVETNPIPVKDAMAQMHGFKPYYRLPLTPISKKAKPLLDAILKELKLI